jgi:glycosyltransferase involved in cell wall biosynthesis
VKKSSIQRVLFIGHSCHVTGAPLLLRELLSHLKVYTTLEPHLLLLADGPLFNDYQSICETEILERANDSFITKLKNWFLETSDNYLNKRYTLNDFNVVYSNTIASTAVAIALYQPGRLIIQHVHELSYAADTLNVREVLIASVAKTYQFIAASEKVAQFLREEIGVDNTKIRVVHEFPVAVAKASESSHRNSVRRTLGISDGDFLIGMCGTPEWRKGVDLFVQLAKKLKNNVEGKKVHLLWIGGAPNQLNEIKHDIRKLELDSCVHLVGDVQYPFDYYEALDLFVLTSREDPFPVAMLEAASSGLPIVCFDNAGGAPEFVQQDAGIVVPYIDVKSMAEACENLINNDELRTTMGERAKGKVETMYAPQQQMAKLVGVIEEALNRSPIL